MAFGRYSENYTVELTPGESLSSYKLLLLVIPTDCRERKGLAQVRDSVKRLFTRICYI